MKLRWWRPTPKQRDATLKPEARRISETDFRWEYDPAGDGYYALVESPQAAPTAQSAMQFDGADVAASDSLHTHRPPPEAPLAAHPTGSVRTSSGPTSNSLETVEPLPANSVSILVKQDAATSYLQHNLDIAADRWREDGLAPSEALTKRALEALSAGVNLTPEQTTLVLQSALFHRKGALTALRFQDDAERTSLVFAEAMTLWDRTLPAAAVLSLRERDPHGETWYTLLLTELRVAAGSTDVRVRRRAVDALNGLFGRPGEGERTHGVRQPRLMPVVLASALLLAVLLVSMLLWVALRGKDELVYVPAGEYTLTLSDGTIGSYATEGFALQVREVTNGEYRRCVASGACASPGKFASAGISDYYTAAEYSVHPVVNVSFEQAEEYCGSIGLRLPTAEEWAMGAVAAPATDMTFRYPWGNEFDVQRANTSESAIGSPAATGSFSPAGDSPIGAADMSGNVAEWTSSTSDDGETRIVKGGSFADGAAQATVTSAARFGSDAISDTIGFRCLKPKAVD